MARCWWACVGTPAGRCVDSAASDSAATDVNAGSGLHGEVTLVEELGADANIYAQTAVGQVTARTHDDPDSLPGIGGGVEFTLSPSARVHFFDQESGQRVG